MAILKERCTNCGGTIIFPQNASVGECDYCGMTYSLSELQKIKEEITEGQPIAKEKDCIPDENESYESALDTSEADEIPIDELCKKSEMALESEQWQIANSFSNEILRRNPKFAKAYLYKLLADCKIFKKEELANCEVPFGDNNNYRLLIRFADIYLRTEIENYCELVKDRYESRASENQYRYLQSQLKVASDEDDFRILANGFYALGNYKDSEKLYEECLNKYKNIRKKQITKSRRKKILIVSAILCVIFAFLAANLLKSASYRSELFTIDVTSKINESYDDARIHCSFKFNINNNGKHNATYLKGSLTIKDTEGNILSDGTSWFRGEIEAKGVSRFTLSWEMDRTDDSVKIWNSDISNLVIIFKITEINFEDGTIKQYRGKEAVVN